ncbi:hypothetical protein D9M71_94630 [compost metagenome]
MIAGHLVDMVQRPLDRSLVGLDAQLRRTGEVEYAMTIELQMLLERGAGREGGVVAAVAAVDHQLAALCGDIAQKLHLLAGALVENDFHALALGEALDLQNQVLLFSDDDLVGTQLLEEGTAFRAAARGDDLGTQRLRQLDGLRRQALPGFGDQDILAWLHTAQVDQGEIGHQQSRVVHAGLLRRQDVGVGDQTVVRHQHQVAPGRMPARRAGREAGNGSADSEVVNALANGFHDAGHLRAKAGR